jgi:hypothetical protein
LVLPLEFGDASLLGDILQLALGHFELRLEAEGIELPVGHGGVVVRLRRVIQQRLIHGRRGGRIPVDKPETEEVVRNREKSRRNHKRRWRSLPPTRAGAASLRLVGGAAPVAATHHGFLGPRW